MKKNTNPFISIILLSIILHPFLLFCQSINYKTAEKVAYNSFSMNSGIKTTDIKISNVIPVTSNNEVCFYIFNFGSLGHTVVSTDKSIEPVLGYGLGSVIDFNNIPPALEYLLDCYKNEIIEIKHHGIVHSDEITAKWDYYLNISQQDTYKSSSTATFLLETKWDQYYGGFNRFCPLYPGTSNRTIVGCGGVALGQILYYWLCRNTPSNTQSYTPENFSTPITINFSNQNYNWFEMDKHYADDYNSLLLFHAAVSIKSNFNINSTISVTSDVPYALSHFWGCGSSDVLQKNSFTYSEWLNKLKNEIDNYRPIFYRGGNSTSSGGHAWVIDGYNSDNKFHCNWGWWGYYDDWYLLTNLSPGGSYYNDSQAAVIYIKPIKDACSDIEGRNTLCDFYKPVPIESHENQIDNYKLYAGSQITNQYTSLNTGIYSFSISEPFFSIIWSNSDNLTQVSGNTGNTFKVLVPYSSDMSAGSITCTVKRSNGTPFSTSTKKVWIGKPSIRKILLPDPEIPFVEIEIKGDGNSDINDQNISSTTWKTTYSTGNGTCSGSGFEGIAHGPGYNWYLEEQVTATNLCGNDIIAFPVAPSPPESATIVNYELYQTGKNVYVLKQSTGSATNINISNDYLYHGDIAISVYDFFGNIVLTSNKNWIDINNLSPGFYIIKAETEDQSISLKINKR